MPATFPSHAAAVLPLKAWRPRAFDGVALVIGAAVLSARLLGVTAAALIAAAAAVRRSSR